MAGTKMGGLPVFILRMKNGKTNNRKTKNKLFYLTITYSTAT